MSHNLTTPSSYGAIRNICCRDSDWTDVYISLQGSTAQAGCSCCMKTTTDSEFTTYLPVLYSSGFKRQQMLVSITHC